jgi:hypothetical protein
MVPYLVIAFYGNGEVKHIETMASTDGRAKSNAEHRLRHDLHYPVTPGNPRLVIYRDMTLQQHLANQAANNILPEPPETQGEFKF